MDVTTLASLLRARGVHRDLDRGLDQVPLEALPIVTRSMLMERFDDLVTDRAGRLADVEAAREAGP